MTVGGFLMSSGEVVEEKEDMEEGFRVIFVWNVDSRDVYALSRFK
jgi:hypothetical protein